jgi:hypothetical protein
MRSRPTGFPTLVERWRLHFSEKIGDIEIAEDIEISGSALGRGGSALQLVETIRAVIRGIADIKRV